MVTQLAKKSLAFMEPEGSVPGSHDPVSGTDPESDDSNPHPHTLSP